MTGRQPFLHELKQRRVARTALIYLAGAFATLQATDLLVPALHLPAWLVTAVAMLVIAGLPLTLALAWLFDITPGGVRRAAPGPDAVPQAWIGRRTLAAVAALLIFGGGLGAGLFLQKRPPAGANGPVTVAVLPFSNLSGDAATEPFVLGLHDDLLTQLSQLAALRVISRTSVLEYRDSPKNIRVIAGELGAGAVVEGGVQRAGDRIRLNVQLIDARSDAHLWAETYERALTAENVFAIQADIARSIARALQAELAPGEEPAFATPPTTDLAALDAYHSGREAFRSGADRRSRIAPRMFERAVELDPSFAEAWAGLSSTRSWLVREGTVRDTAAALEALQRGRALAPGTLATLLAEAYFHYYARADLRAARAAFSAAYAAAPGSAEALEGLALVERRLGRIAEAIAHLQEAARLDPRNPAHDAELAWTFAFVGDAHAAVTHGERALRRAPDDVTANLSQFGYLLWVAGDTAAARRLAGENMLAGDAPVFARWQAQLALARRDYPAALAAATHDTVLVDFQGYGAYFSPGLPQLMKAAWLAGDRAALRGASVRALAVADSLAALLPAAADRWGRPAEPLLLRALAYVFTGDTVRSLAAAEAARAYIPMTDVITAAQILDHIAVVQILAGRHDDALDAIERLVHGPSLLKPARLRLDPIYDPLRRHQRFRVLAGGA
jgi:TolB-like protein